MTETARRREKFHIFYHRGQWWLRRPDHAVTNELATWHQVKFMEWLLRISK